jgi:hypothetical protein
MVLRIQVRKKETRSNASGNPRAHGMFHETVPMTAPPETSGPPESPWQIPCPAWVKVQILWSKTKAALPVEWRFRQSALVKVLVLSPCSWFGALTVPTWADPKAIADTWVLKEMTVAVCTTETSLAMVCELYDGWLTILELWWLTPPEFKKIVPTRTRTAFWARPIVQWAAESTQRLLMIEPPQKWELALVRSETWRHRNDGYNRFMGCKFCNPLTWYGNWPAEAPNPPTILPPRNTSGTGVALARATSATSTKSFTIIFVRELKTFYFRLRFI